VLHQDSQIIAVFSHSAVYVKNYVVVLVYLFYYEIVLEVQKNKT